VVPVLRDVDRKGVYDLAAELALVSEKARAHKLMPGDMQAEASPSPAWAALAAPPSRPS
jgi:pyruvate/2-oxoglutarate dehydrogenase complex dihydrolipoamide acyltransferase (E2) component